MPALEALINAGHNVCGVYTQPDRPAGRGQKMQFSPVKQAAVDHGIPVFQPASLKGKAEQQELAALKPDIMVVVAYGLLLPKAVLDIPTHGCLNIHASILPRWRGAAPIHRAVIAGDAETGITIMQMDEGLDTGDMLLVKTCAINPNETSGQLHDRLMQMGGSAIVEAITDLPSRQAAAEKQDDSLANYAHKLKKEESQIDWQQSAEQLKRQVLGLNPWPVAQCDFQGKAMRVFDAQTVEANGQPGTVLESKERLVIACGEGALALEEVQLPGKKRTPISAFLNGRSLETGCKLAGE